jgi:cytochrome c-type biogenesis protein CcmH/NrfG
MRYRAAATSIVLACLAGCGQKAATDAKQQAYNRWYRLRADMLCGVGAEHLRVGLLDKASNKGRYPAAIEHLTRAYQMNRNSAEAVYLLAVAQEKNKSFAEALKNYYEAYRLDSSSLDAVMAATEVLVAMGRIQEAQLYLGKYIAPADNNPGMFELAGRLAMMTAEYAKAADFFEDACDVDMKNHRYKEKLARAQFLAGRYAKARQTLDGLTASKEYSPGVWVYVMLGNACLATDRPDEALTAYEKAARLDGSSGTIWAGIAKADLVLGHSERAALAAKRALALDKGNVDASMLLGYAMLTDGRVEEALTHLIAATKKHPKDSTLWCLLGRAHAAARNSAQAVRRYSTAARLDPDNRLARELLDAPYRTEASEMN